MKKYFLFYATFVVFNISVSQEVRGIVFDATTKLPLESVSVYFDQTTIGTITNRKGEFTLKNTNIKTPLIISYIGYNTKIIPKFSTVEVEEFYLFESQDLLDEIIISTNDNWSRDLKLKEFKKHYLGESKRGWSCRILNEDDLVLTFNKRKRILTVTSKSPLTIKNNALNYTITVNLEHFEAKYSFISKNKKRRNIESVSYFGTSFYKPYPSVPKEKILAERNATYQGSVLHFMRALSKKKMKENGYKVYLSNGESNLDNILELKPLENGDGVFVTIKGVLNVLYKNKNKSIIRTIEDGFYIDSFGNHTPPLNVKFFGDFGNQRLGDTLPLDFSLPIS